MPEAVKRSARDATAISVPNSAKREKKPEIVLLASSRPTIFIFEPFGEDVEGLSYCGTKTCAVEAAVQTDDFENSALGRVIGRKPLLPKRLRKFKRFQGNLGRFVVRTVEHVELQPNLGQPVA